MKNRKKLSFQSLESRRLFDAGGIYFSEVKPTSADLIVSSDTFLADITGDGAADIIQFDNDGVLASVSGPNGFAPATRELDKSVQRQGSGGSRSARHVLDINDDGKADIVEFGQDGVMVAMGNAQGFGFVEQLASYDFGANRGWGNEGIQRSLADVTGDGILDIVGFGWSGFWVAPGKPDGKFEPLGDTAWRYVEGWGSNEYQRELADVNGDGRDDIVGIDDRGAWVSIAGENEFGVPELWTKGLDGNLSWSNPRHHLTLSDVDGDGLADLVGFGEDGVYVAISTGAQFMVGEMWVDNYSVNYGWEQTNYPRYLRDMNNDGLADIVGFGGGGVYVSTSTGEGFTPPTELAVKFFGHKQGWLGTNTTRAIVDSNSDGFLDIVGISPEGTYISQQVDGAKGTPINRAVDPIWFEVVTPAESNLKTIRSDLNGNGAVEFDDFLLLSQNFGTSGESAADIDGDGEVGFGDFLLLSSEFGRTDDLVEIPIANQNIRAVQGQWIVQVQDEALRSLRSPIALSEVFDDHEIQVLFGTGVPGEVVVKTSATDVFEAETLFQETGIVESFFPNAVMPLAALPNDPLIGGQWGLHNTGQSFKGVAGTADSDIDAIEAWDLTIGSRDVVVGVVDSGVDVAHPDLRANVWRNPGEIPGNGLDDDGNGFVDDVNGWDFVDGDNNPDDPIGHGTHVAGIIGAVGNNHIGVSGVAQEVNLMALRACNNFCSAGHTRAATNYATVMRNRGVNVVATNNSYDGAGGWSLSTETIAQAGKAGILFIGAAGNGNGNFANPQAALDNVISVAAVDADDQRSFWDKPGCMIDVPASNCGSNFGAHVHIAAPGTDILSTRSGGGYIAMSGTSMATPHVAGVAALAASLAPDVTMQAIRDAIFAGVDHVANLTDQVSTGGRLNAANTLALLRESVILYEGNNASQDVVCILNTRANQSLNFQNHQECDNDEARSMVLNAVPAGTTIALFDSPSGNLQDDWVEVIVKRDIHRKEIGTFERSFEDSDVRVNFHRNNGLDGKVSRLEVSAMESGPRIDLYEGNDASQNLICGLPASVGHSLDFTQHAACDNDEARSMVLWNVPAGRTIRLFDSPTGDTQDDWTQIDVLKSVSNYRIASFEQDVRNDTVRVTHFRNNGLDGKVSRVEIVPTMSLTGFVSLFEGNDATQNKVCDIPTVNAHLNFKNHSGCDNDEVRSLLLTNVRAGTRIAQFGQCP